MDEKKRKPIHYVGDGKRGKLDDRELIKVWENPELSPEDAAKMLGVPLSEIEYRIDTLREAGVPITINDLKEFEESEKKIDKEFDENFTPESLEACLEALAEATGEDIEVLRAKGKIIGEAERGRRRKRKGK